MVPGRPIAFAGGWHGVSPCWPSTTSHQRVGRKCLLQSAGWQAWFDGGKPRIVLLPNIVQPVSRVHAYVLCSVGVQV